MPRHPRSGLQEAVASKQTNKQTNKQPNKQPNNQTNKHTNKQTNKQTKSVEPNRMRIRQLRADVRGQRAVGTDAAYALRVRICDAAAYLEETQQLDVRGVRVRLRHVRQQRLLGAGGRDLL